MPDFHLKLAQQGLRGAATVVAIDTEWAKYWRARTKFVPFCAAVHAIHLPVIREVIDVATWAMESELYFRAEGETATEYASAVDTMIERHVGPGTVVVGHQLSSDLHLLRTVAERPLPTVGRLLAGLKARHMAVSPGELTVRDTRYDIRSRRKGNGGEKLRNVSLRLRVFAVQTELNATSLTKLYDRFRRHRDPLDLERLVVVNWRHAFQTALVWIVDGNPDAELRNAGRRSSYLVTNDVIHAMAMGRISYVATPDFAKSRSRKGLSEYVRTYAPEIAEDVGL